MTPKEKQLGPQRNRIDEIDTKLLDLLSERSNIVQEVIEKKIKNRLPIFAPEREDDKTDRFRRMAEQRDLDPDWAEDFLRMIMASSRASQSSNEFPRATEEPKDILIVARAAAWAAFTRALLSNPAIAFIKSTNIIGTTWKRWRLSWIWPSSPFPSALRWM